MTLIFALPLDFHGRVRVVRSMYLPSALHGIEASLLASDSLRKLRSSMVGVVWSRRQPLARVGAFLSLLDGPTGCDPAFCVTWFQFQLLRRYLSLWPTEVGRVYRLLEVASGVALGMVLFIFSPPVLLTLASGGILLLLLGLGLDCLCLVTWLVLFNILRLLPWMLGVARFQLIFVGGPVFGVVRFWMLRVLCSSLILLMLERDKALLQSIMVGGVWNGCLLGRVRGQPTLL